MILWSALCLLGLTTNPALAFSEGTSIHNNFGSAGMIDMPSARMAPDGELSVGASFFQNTQRYNFGFQVLPWLETSFRYSGLEHFDPTFPVYYDRSFALKARLWDETRIFPAVAVGVDDIIGTGLYSGEYLVASKKFGSFDTSLGIGWGRPGSTDLFRNPFSLISRSFNTRPGLSAAGNTDFNTLFHGHNAGLFGGVVWHTPIEKLSLTAEYSSDTYALEQSRGAFAPRNQMNYGASYQVTDSITVGLDWLYGRSIGGSVSFQLNPVNPQYPAKVSTQPIPVAIRSPEQQQQALQTILRQHNGALAASQRASLNRTDFVDALWHQNKIRNVEISGQSLVLTASGDTGPTCIAAAQLAQYYGGKITVVLVRSTDGRAPTQCVTAFAASPAYQYIPFASIVGFFSNTGNETSVRTIDASRPDPNAGIRAIRAAARKQKITIEALSLTESTATVYYNNFHYFAEADAIDRLTRILMRDTSPDIERFRLIAVSNGVPQQEFDILRGPEERKFSQIGTLDLFGDTSAVTATPPPMQNPVLAAAERNSYPRFSWDVFPQLRQELFDPDNPFAIQLAAGAEASLEIVPGFLLNGEVETSLFDNFNLDRQSNSTLPHVRSDFLKYFAQGKSGIGDLKGEYHLRLAPNVFATAKAGYLESMFAGGGGEVLWRPEGQRWALGADGYEVWQRNFDRLFGLQGYHVFTGHVSLYYASPWYGLNFAVSAGQYLAGDRGLTFQMTRRFSTGVEVGAFFTKTNVSAAQFGEGSFDKGIIIRIPLDWALPIETQGQWGIDLRPVQRDGGQRLLSDATLFDETRRSSEAEWRSGPGP